MSSVPTLAYFDIHGLAEPIRMLLKYAGVEFNDKRYQFGPGATSFYDMDLLRKYWNDKKYTLGLDFPNLPYFIDGDIKLTQSMTILRYIARKHGLVATDDVSAARQDLIEQQIQDFRDGKFVKEVLVETATGQKDMETAKKEFLKNLPPQLELYSKFLGKNEWFAGTLTYVDFLVYEVFDWVRLLDDAVFDKFPNLAKFLTRFKSLPAIKAYMNSSEFKETSYFPHFVPIGQKKE